MGAAFRAIRTMRSATAVGCESDTTEPTDTHAEGYGVDPEHGEDVGDDPEMDADREGCMMAGMVERDAEIVNHGCSCPCPRNRSTLANAPPFDRTGRCEGDLHATD